SRGFRIDSPDEGAQLGHAVAGAGDVNGDGLADVIVGAPEAPGAGNTAPPGFLRSGAAYVVFGKRDSQPVNLEALGSGGLAIRGTQQIERVGESVAGLGDVNGDGIADIAVAAPGHATNPGNGPAGGAAYVVFGRKGAASDIRLDALGDRGYEIDGSRRNFGS